MFHIRGLDDSAEPCALRSRICRKVEYDGNAFRQESANVRRERIVQQGRPLHVSRYIGNLARTKAIQHLVLHKENSIVSRGQLSRESRLSCRHLATEEYQFCGCAHARIVPTSS